MTTFQGFINIIEEMILFFSQATAVEMQKLKAVEKNRISLLEDFMKKEQVMNMKLRAFDKRRDILQTELGYEKLSLREILEKSSPEEKKLLTPLIEQLESEVNLFSNTLDSAGKLMEVNLHKINASMSQTVIPNFTNQTI